MAAGKTTAAKVVAAGAKAEAGAAAAKAAAAAISGSTLVEFAALGHSPQVQDPKQFNAALLKALESR